MREAAALLLTLTLLFCFQTNADECSVVLSLDTHNYNYSFWNWYNTELRVSQVSWPWGNSSSAYWNTVVLHFCSRLDNVLGDYQANPPPTWVWDGSLFGLPSEIVQNTDGQYANDAVDAVRSFRMYFISGDSGYPCLNGRNGEVVVLCDQWCYGIESDSCPSGAGDSTACICNATYDRAESPCSISVTMAMQCPQFKESETVTEAEKVGQIVAIFVLSFLAVLVITVLLFEPTARLILWATRK